MAGQVKLSPRLAGISGEYYVAAELSRRGYIASVTLRNTEGIDILASTTDSSRMLAIQVKTRQDAPRDWRLDIAAETHCSDHLFYIFLNLKEAGKRPDFFIVPSQIVAQFARDYHHTWLTTLGKKGQQHRDNPMRKFLDKEGKFLERWDLLSL